MNLPRIICLLRTRMNINMWVPICGCRYKEQEDGSLVCKVCGDVRDTK